LIKVIKTGKTAGAYLSTTVLHGEVQRRIAFLVTCLYVVLFVGGTVSLSWTFLSKAFPLELHTSLLSFWQPEAKLK